VIESKIEELCKNLYEKYKYDLLKYLDKTKTITKIHKNFIKILLKNVFSETSLEEKTETVRVFYDIFYYLAFPEFAGKKSLDKLQTNFDYILNFYENLFTKNKEEYLKKYLYNLFEAIDKKASVDISS
jgi:hypothetical protein